MTTQKELTNTEMQALEFLSCMYNDAYFPKFLVDKCRDVLVMLCVKIEESKPADLDALYPLTHAATEQINALEEEFYANESEIETGARECLAEGFFKVAQAYGFNDADIEELIAPRDW